jgi:membrane associated rhomboid family serine protease
MAVCYRHKDRETGVSCSNCGRPICPDCMTATPVGMRCPECSRQRTKTQTLQSMYGQPTATYVIMGICIVMWLGEYLSGGRGSQVYEDFSLIGGALNADGDTIGVAAGEYWRLITSGFLHDPRNPLHLGFNMYVLYWLGTMLEPVLGTARFVGLYFASLLAGALGALLLTDTTAATTGASGAVFGLMAAAFVMQRARGINPMQSGIGPVILLNLGITFLIPNISIGGHLGGLIAGALCALGLTRFGRGSAAYGRPGLVGIATILLVGVASIGIAYWKAKGYAVPT